MSNIALGFIGLLLFSAICLGYGFIISESKSYKLVCSGKTIVSGARIDHVGDGFGWHGEGDSKHYYKPKTEERCSILKI